LPDLTTAFGGGSSVLSYYRNFKKILKEKFFYFEAAVVFTAIAVVLGKAE